MATVPGHHRAAATQRSAKAAPRRGLRRLAGRVACPQCNNTGAIWVICPDAGAVKLPCECGRHASPARIDLADIGLAVTMVACCGLAYFLI